MSTLTVRNVEPKIVTALKRRAKMNKRSLEAELRTIIAEAVADHDFVLAEMRRISGMTPKDRAQTDSVRLLREDRNR